MMLLINNKQYRKTTNLKFYNNLMSDVDNFLKFYEKNNYTDDNMYPYHIINSTFNMIKNNDDLKNIISLWNTRLNYIYDADGNSVYNINDNNIIDNVPFA